MDADAGGPEHPRDAEAQVLAQPGSTDFTFLLVDHQFEFAGDEAADRSHHPFRRLGAADIDDAVIRIAHEAQAAPFELLVELVEHDIG